jgi:hypothetical protein
MILENYKLAEHASVLAYSAPFLIDKLVKDHIVDTPEEAEVLFTEVKKYLLMVRDDETANWEMYSLRVDEVWHQFILYTNEYMNFCERFFGRYVPHSPSNAPEPPFVSSTREVCTFELFASHYEQLFGIQLPEIWYDERSITIQRRVLNDNAGILSLKDKGEMVDLLTSAGKVLFSVNPFARDALAFAARTGAFYVRELPGGLADEEKIALVSGLVESSVLRVGA